MTQTNLLSSLTMAFGMALGTLLYDWFRHTEEVAEDFPNKYLFMFVCAFVGFLIVKSVISAVKANRAPTDA